MTHQLPPGTVPLPEITPDIEALGELLFNIYGCSGIGASESYERGRGHWQAIASILVEKLGDLGWVRL